MIFMTYSFDASGQKKKKTQSFLPRLPRFLPRFSLLLPLLRNHCALQSSTHTHQASDRNPFMHLQCVRLEEGKHALEASWRNTRSPRGDLPFVCLGCKKQTKKNPTTTTWHVSIQVQTCQEGAQSCNGIRPYCCFSHINNKHQLYP